MYKSVKSVFKKSNPTLGGSYHPLIPQPFIDSAASAIAELVCCFILRGRGSQAKCPNDSMARTIFFEEWTYGSARSHERERSEGSPTGGALKGTWTVLGSGL